MHLTPQDIDKLILHQVGALAQKRLARGLRLNYPEAVALIASQLLELIRDGKSVAELMDLGRRFLGTENLMPGVAALITEVQVEGTFPDGSKLVTVHDPICTAQGDMSLALYGSFLPLPAQPLTTHPSPVHGEPGEVLVAPGEITLNEGRKTLEIAVTNQGDRPIQVGSHYPFTETNRALAFDRQTTVGMHLNIIAGTAVRFEPGETKTVQLVMNGSGAAS